MKKILILFLLFLPVLASAQEQAAPINQVFKARVVEVLSEKKVSGDNGQTENLQDLKLIGLQGEFKGKTIEIRNAGDSQAGLVKSDYKVGELVLVSRSVDESGAGKFFITDYARTGSLLWLLVIFCLSIVVVGRWKGLRSLLSLVLTFLIIMKYIVPQIMDGADPIAATLIGSLAILLVIIYVTEGFSRRSHVSVLSIFISLVATVFLSWLFVNLTKLSGLASEEAAFVLSLGHHAINLKGLLLAGIIIGSLGVLDDAVISQVATVEEIARADAMLSAREIFRRAYQVGVSHISSMTNTLFLAYTGASLPLLILFLNSREIFASWDIAINNEMLATEIVRTLAGSVGLILSVPIATALAAWWVKRK